MIKDLKNLFWAKMFPFTGWLPRYYIFFKWAPFPKDAVVLDLACGEGYVSLKLAQKCKKIVGLDISAHEIQLANDKKSRSKFKDKVDFMVGDILCMPFAAETFDRVVCLDALQHIENYKVALAEISRVLKPSGCLVVTNMWRSPCAAFLFKSQAFLRKIVPRFLYREYLSGGVRWLEADNELIKKRFKVYHQFDPQELTEAMKPYFKMSRYKYFLKRCGAIVTDLTYGLAVLWTIRFIFFYLAVRADYYLGGNEAGYSIIAEFTKML